jgi:hypothetical protein
MNSQKHVVNDEMDDESDSGSAVKKQPTVFRFYHEYFQANRPELLYKIQRANKSSELPSLGQMEELKSQIEKVNERMVSIEEKFNSKLATMREALEHDYLRRIALVEASYKDLLVNLVRSSVLSKLPTSFADPLPQSQSLQQRLLALAASTNNFAIRPQPCMQSYQHKGSPAGSQFDSTLTGVQRSLQQSTSPASSNLVTFQFLGRL